MPLPLSFARICPMNICPTCHGKYRRAGTLQSHIRQHRNPDFRPNPKELATAEELAAAGLPAVAPGSAMVDNPASKFVKGEGMAEPQTVAELRAELENTKLKEENQALKADLATANSHQRLGTVLTHAREACTDCRQDLDQHNQRVIKAAFEGLDVVSARDLALAKGALPNSLNFQV